MQNHNRNLPAADTVLEIACVITRADIELARESNYSDRSTIIWQAVALGTVSLIALLFWTAFFSMFLAWQFAIMGGLVVALAVFLIDQAMGASDWELVGVLRTEPISTHWWCKLAARISIAVILSFATAWAATTFFLRDAIENELQIERVKQNAPLEKEYATKKEALQARLVAPVEAELIDIRAERLSVAQNLEAARATSVEQQQRASSARIELGREKYGDLSGYVKGEGSRWREAKRQLEEADLLSASTVAEINKYDLRQQDLTERIDTKTVQLAAASLEFDKSIQMLDTQKIQDARWIPERNDALLQAMALQRLKNHPVYGGVATQVSWTMQLVLIILEMMFLLIKTIFTPASVYIARLIARTKCEAVEIDVECARVIAEMRRNRPRPGLRVVPMNGENGRQASQAAGVNQNIDEVHQS